MLDAAGDGARNAYYGRQVALGRVSVINAKRFTGNIAQVTYVDAGGYQSVDEAMRAQGRWR